MQPSIALPFLPAIPYQLQGIHPLSGYPEYAKKRATDIMRTVGGVQ